MIVKVLVDTAVASTISSMAVSGSITRVNVLPAGIVAPPSKAEPDTTVIDVVPEVIAPVSVVCWLRDEYWRVVIYVPIGCSALGEDIGTGMLQSLRASVEHKERKVAWLQMRLHHMDACHLSRLLVG